MPNPSTLAAQDEGRLEQKPRNTKIAVVGSRGYPDEDEVRSFIHNLPRGVIVISGGAKGVDTWAEDQACREGLEMIIFKPNYELLGPTFAPRARNGQIVATADRMEAFWDGESPGTIDAIQKMLNASKPVNVRIKRLT